MALSQWKALYQVSPITLVGGLASSVPGNMLPVLALSQPNLMPLASQLQASLLAQVQSQSNVANLGGTTSGNLDDAFGAFNVLPGGTLCVNTVPKYPLADNTMASNAIVRDPINVSVIWDTPMRGANAWTNKLSVMEALKQTLDRHNNLGGLYIVMTPAHYYDNLILTSLTDNSRGGNSLPQNAWRFDFERPMVMNTVEGAASQNLLMSKITAGVPAPITVRQEPTTGRAVGPV
jgi:hypothetical protein